MKNSCPFYNANFYIISGGPGVGKTSLLLELENRNYTCIAETAREIIKEQVLVKGEALPWKDKSLFLKLMFEGSVEAYKKAEKLGKRIIFFDRGIPDSLTYAEIIGTGESAGLEFYVRNFRYNPKVFFLQPWKDIYETDEERKQNWEEAVLSAKINESVYRRLGYSIIEVPNFPVLQRADFVLGNV